MQSTRPAAGNRWEGLASQAARLASGEVSSVELVDAALTRAASAQQSVNAFRVLRAEQALAEARRADERLAAGERSALLGVPVAVKDDTDLEGYTTPFGCGGQWRAATADCEAIRRLRQAGAIVIGKTHTPELGLYPWTEGPAFGVTRNPWNLSHTPGGSSGGSAAAVAAGIVPAALGSDGAGSVRIPASWTHLVGIKACRGRVSTWPDAEAFFGVTHIGPLARTVADAALLLDSVSGNVEGDRHRPPPPEETFAALAGCSPRRLRIAFSLAPPWVMVPTEPDAEVVSVTRDVAECLARLGHRVEEEDPPYGYMGVPFAVRGSAGVADWAARMPPEAVIDPRTREAVRTGRVAMGPLLAASRRAEKRVAARFSRFFDRFDVVLTPATARPPLPVGAADGLSGWRTDRLMAAACPYAWPWNFLGWPALTVPAGLVADDLPVGAQLAGPPSHEGVLVSLAAEMEEARSWPERHPSLPL